MGKVIGIDLGTTNSCVAFSDGRHTNVIPNRSGYKTTPSMVAFLEDDKRLVGQLAKRQAITNPQNTISSAKRLIGRRIDSPEVRIAKAIYPYEIVEGPHDDVRVKALGREYSLPEISSFVLSEMKRVAESFLQDSVSDVVITVPAYFNDGQRQATKDAGRIAGLNVLRIINEPTAAAIAYGFNKKANKKVAVYDLGGGTFDISILEIHEGVFKVLATSGDTFLGGDDFDNLLIDHVADIFLKETKLDVRQDRMALQRLKDACEKAKIDLSTSQTADVNLPFILTSESGPMHLNQKISRKTLEGLCANLVSKTFTICKECLELAGLTKDDLDDVLLVGGQTRMPYIQDGVSNFFGRSASKQVHPDEVVAMGAAIQAHALTAEDEVDMLLLDVTPLPLGIKSAGGAFTKLIEANTTVPVRENKVFTTVSNHQASVRIQVYQGDSPVAEENDMLGEFLLDGIRKAPAGEPEIEVTFEIDANGIVNVFAKDLDTGKEQSITVTMSSGLTDNEIEEMRKQAEQYDVAIKGQEETELYSQKAEVLHHKIQKAFSEKRATMDAKRAEQFETMIQKTPSFFAESDVVKLKTLVTKLEKALKELES